MSIRLTPEEIKALYAYIYGGSCTQEEYQLGAEIASRKIQEYNGQMVEIIF